MDSLDSLTAGLCTGLSAGQVGGQVGEVERGRGGHGLIGLAGLESIGPAHVLPQHDRRAAAVAVAL